MHIERWNISIADSHAYDVKEGRMGWRKLRTNYPELTEHQARAFVAAARGDTFHEIGATFGVDPDDDGSVAATLELNDGVGVLTVLTPGTISTQEELFAAAKVSQEEWEVTGMDVKKWDAHQKGPDDQPIVIQMFAVRAKLKPRFKAVALKGLAAQLLQDIEEKAPPAKKRSYEMRPGKRLGVIQFPDVHFGKHDPEQQLREFEAAVDYLVGMADHFGVTKWLIVTGNDATHIDNVQGTTTSGTQLEYVETWQHNFRVTRRAWSYAIDRCADIAEVDFLVVPGNHDENTAFAIGEVVDAWYRNDPTVTLVASGEDDDPLRKYYRFGVSLLGFTHGKFEKLNDLPMLMAQERPTDWSQTVYREIFTGDKHHRKVTNPGRRITSRSGELSELMGVVVRISPSLSMNDGYHKRHGYYSMRGAEVHIYDAERGKVGEFSYVPE